MVLRQTQESKTQESPTQEGPTQDATNTGVHQTQECDKCRSATNAVVIGQTKDATNAGVVYISSLNLLVITFNSFS